MQKKTILPLLVWALIAIVPAVAQRINDLTGINAKSFDPVAPQLRFSWVRAWHDWSDDIGFRGHVVDCPDIDSAADWQLRWNPSYNPGGPYLLYDAYHQQLQGRAIPVLKGLAPAMRGYTGYNGCYDEQYAPLEQKPFCPLTNYTNNSGNYALPALSALPDTNAQKQPMTFEEHALWLSLFAARYGPGTWPGTFIDPYVDDQETGQIVGQGTISYLEDNNETNKTWYDAPLSGIDFETGRTYWYFSPRQYAAMFSADYDGNEDELAVGARPIGVINAAPGMDGRMAMAGVAGLCGAYLEHMAAHWDTLRASNPSLIANFHHYCNDVTAQQTTVLQFSQGEYADYTSIFLNNNGHGVSPEDDKLRDKLQWLRGGLQSIGATEYWLSEFGYDSNPSSSNASGVDAQSIDGQDGHYDSQKVQAQWLVRGVLEAAWSQSIHKMMLYELRDDVAQQGTSYGYSGLLTAAGAAKRAWYYVMTLKHVLGEHTYFEDMVDGQEDFDVTTTGNVSGEAPRIYEFRNGSADTKIFAIWSPTDSAFVYDCDITFPSNNPDYSVNGQATLIHIEELSEVGRKEDWSAHVSGQTVQDIPVSETPVFLIIGGRDSTRFAEPVQNLDGATACCGAARLTWTLPTGFKSQNTLVFYRMANPSQPCPAFDFSKSTLFTNYTGPNRTEIVVTGLQDTTYCFWVFPIGPDGLPQRNLLDTASVVQVAVTGCTGCLIPIDTSEIAFDPAFPAQNPTGLAQQKCQVRHLLRVADIPLACADLRDTIASSDTCFSQLYDGWTFWQTPYTQLPEPNTFFINFDTSKRITAIYAHDRKGNGRIRIEYRDCTCLQWRLLTDLELTGEGLPRYIELSNLPPVTVRQLKVTRLYSSGSLSRLVFCGHDAACPSRTTIDPGNVAALRADEIRQNSAVLRWRAALYDLDDPQSVYVDNYEFRLAQQVDQNNELVNPVSYTLPADPFDAAGSYRLGNLAPGTEYFVDVFPNPGAAICVDVPGPPVARVSFTTESEEQPRELQRQKTPQQLADPFQVLLRPNPATDRVEVRITTGELSAVQVLDNHGRTVRRQSAAGAATALDLAGLPTGIYWVRTVRADGAQLTVYLVKR